MDADKILRAYFKGRKPLKGIKTFNDAQLYAEGVGTLVSEVLTGNIDFETITEEELIAILRKVMRQGYADSATAAVIAQRLINEQSGLGLKALESEYDPVTAVEVAAELIDKASADGIESIVGTRLIRAVDDTIKINAEAQQNAGLTVHIVRKYSDRGLRAGTKWAEDCEWCLARCGEWTNVKEAKADGAFERHPGCLCMIEYDVNGTHTWSREKGTWLDK